MTSSPLSGRPSVAPLVAVVDDDEGVTRALDGLFRSLGYRVATFDRAEAFLASTVAAEAACIVSDLRMPGASGIDLIDRFPGPGAVILLSAFLDEVARRRAVAAGAWSVLDKRCIGQELVDQVEAAIASRGRASS